MNSMEVVVVERSRLADILRGVGTPSGAAISGFEGKLVRELHMNTVGVGYCDDRASRLPHFVVIPGADRREFFAWVNTFCPVRNAAFAMVPGRDASGTGRCAKR